MQPEINIPDVKTAGNRNKQPSKEGVLPLRIHLRGQQAQSDENVLHEEKADPQKSAVCLKEDSSEFRRIMKTVIAANKKALADKGYGSNKKTEEPASFAIIPQSPTIGEVPRLPTIHTSQIVDATETGWMINTINATNERDEMTIDGGSQAGQTTFPDASDIIRQALETISSALHLKIGQGLETVRIDGAASQTVKEQLAEVLVALNGIAALLNDVVALNQTIDIAGKTLNATQVALLEKTLRLEVFHIELGLTMAHIGGEVAGSVAQKNNTPVNNGLMRATDPETIDMPAAQIKHILENMLLSKGEKVETLFLQLAQSVRQRKEIDGGRHPLSSPTLPENQDATVQELQTTAAAGVKQNSKAPERGDIDSRVMRTLLKIDKTETENKSAAEHNETVNLPKLNEALFAKMPGELPGQHEKKRDTSMPGVFMKETTDTFETVMTSKTSKLPQSVEESVMNQLAGKIQASIKSGVTEIRLLLKPESLGEMRVKLMLDGDVVMGKIYVENQQVKHIIENNMQSLRDSLSQHNLQTGSFDVDIGAGAREQGRAMTQATVLHQTAEESSDVTETLDNGEDFSSGQETGRRFGSNTIEYFA